MKILQIIPSLYTGGAERTAIDIADYLAKNKIENYIITQEGSLIPSINKNTKLIIARVKDKNPLTVIYNIFFLMKIIKKYDIDIVHVRSRIPALSTFYACKFAHKKYLTTFHGIYSINNSLKKFFNSYMLKGEMVIANSNFTKNHILENYQISKDKITIIHRGIDTEYFTSDFNISDYDYSRNVNFLVGARFTRWKGQDIAIKALYHLSLERKNFKAYFIGEKGEHQGYYQECVELVKKYKLEDNIVFLEPTKNFKKYLAMSDIVISPSNRPEAFGRVICEAMSMGKIVVASNIGGACETIINNKTSFHFENNNDKDLFEKIKNILLLDKNSAFNIAKMAQNHVKDNFSLQNMCNKTLDIYKKII